MFLFFGKLTLVQYAAVQSINEAPGIFMNLANQNNPFTSASSSGILMCLISRCMYAFSSPFSESMLS